MSAMLTRDRLADILGVTPRTVKQWATDGTLPPTTWVLSGSGQSGYEFSPRAVMIGELMVELGEVFGSNSPLPKRITEQVVRELDRLGWPTGRAIVTVICKGLEIRTTLSFLRTAREKLAALASA